MRGCSFGLYTERNGVKRATRIGSAGSALAACRRFRGCWGDFFAKVPLTAGSEPAGLPLKNTIHAAGSSLSAWFGQFCVKRRKIPENKRLLSQMLDRKPLVLYNYKMHIVEECPLLGNPKTKLTKILPYLSQKIKCFFRNSENVM